LKSKINQRTLCRVFSCERNYVRKCSEVLIAGFGERGMLLETFLELKIQGLKVSSASLLILFKEKKEKPGSKAKWRNFTKRI
ncbi:hypothetical protein RJ640_007624, partial [Escallonia rubra]